MPVQLPLKSARKAARVPAAFDVWSGTLAAVASGLALFVYLATGHTTGAVLVLVLVAALIAAVVYACRHPGDAGDV